MKNETTVYTVTQLNKQIRNWLEYEIGEVTVVGELSNVSRPNSGHIYFTLKDQAAQIRCVFFKNLHRSTETFKDGQQVIAKGKLSLYEARGDYQLIVRELTSAGLGELYQQFEALKIKLSSAGYFDRAIKKPLPETPAKIGVISSATGAALQDILTTLQRRFPIADVFIYPCEVQGKQAHQQLIRAVTQANQDKFVDVLILARGGGSIEDLWAFNNEQLAMTIVKSQIPIVTGIGHETDITIADFVADHRAATPTAAAESVTPDKEELLSTLRFYENQLTSIFINKLNNLKTKLSHFEALLASPEYLIASQWQTLDYFEKQLVQSLRSYLNKHQHNVAILQKELASYNPRIQLQLSRATLEYNQKYLTTLLQQYCQNLQQTLTKQMATLYAVSPLATLERGYAIASKNGEVIRDIDDIQLKEEISVRLAKGELSCTVTGKNDAK